MHVYGYNNMCILVYIMFTEITTFSIVVDNNNNMIKVVIKSCMPT